jgi:hypothetical protein
MHPPRVEQLIYVAHALGLYARKLNQFDHAGSDPGSLSSAHWVHTRHIFRCSVKHGSSNELL